MRPDQRWFPTNRVERAAKFDHFARTLPGYAAALGFTQADIDAVNADNDIVQFFARSILATDRYLDAMRAAEKQLLFGRRGQPTPRIPPPPSIAAPDMPVTGVFERLERLVRYIRTLPAYSDSMGESLGIVPRKAAKPEANTFRPTLKLEGGAGYKFTIKFVKSGFPMAIAEVRRAGSSDWVRAGHFMVSPAKIELEPLVPGMPEVVYVRLRICEDNVPVGNYSPERPVTLMP